MISGYRVDKKQKRFFFKDKSQANRKLKELASRLDREGRAAKYLDEATRVMAVRCTETLKEYGKTISDATDYYLQHLKDTQKPNTTIAQLLESLLEHEAALKRSAVHQRDLRWRLERFSQEFGDRIVREVTRSEITTWLMRLKGLSPQSRHNYRARLAILFRYGVKNGYADLNPVTGIELERLVDSPPEIFTPEELLRVLGCADPDVLPLLAIGAFAGLRTAELLRLEWEDLVRNHVRVEAAKSKTATRRVVPCSPNLIAWLAPYTGRAGKLWSLTVASYYWRLEETKKAAHLAKWPLNGLRHSFASYHLAKYGNAAELAHLMGHTNSRMLYDHYREVVYPQDAERYWSIFPPTRAQNVVPMLEASGT
jgi:integrase